MAVETMYPAQFSDSSDESLKEAVRKAILLNQLSDSDSGQLTWGWESAADPQMERGPAVGNGSRCVIAGVVLGIGLIGGSGASLTPKMFGKSPSSGRNEAAVISDFEYVESAAQASLSVSDKMVVIKEAFGLFVADMARIFGASRPTIYQWMQGGVPRSSNQARINVIFGLALDWQRESGLPMGDFFDHEEYGGHSVKELLMAEEIDVEAVRNYYPTMAGLVRDQWNAKNAVSPAATMKSMGFSKPNASAAHSVGSSASIEEDVS